MISLDLLDQLPENERDSVAAAIKTIANSGLIATQRQQNYARVLQGADTEEPEKLAERIMEYRRNTNALATFEHLAQKLAERN